MPTLYLMGEDTIKKKDFWLDGISGVIIQI